jgi:hypothetical protein
VVEEVTDDHEERHDCEEAEASAPTHAGLIHHLFYRRFRGAAFVSPGASVESGGHGRHEVRREGEREMSAFPKPKYLFRECCKEVVPVEKKYGDIEMYKCKCGKTTKGQFLKYYDTKAEAEKVKAEKMGDAGAPDLGALGNM